jgi:hexosaminidase
MKTHWFRFLIVSVSVCIMACTNINEQVYNQGINIIPKPQNITEQEGSFVLDKTTAVKLQSSDIKSVADYFLRKIQLSTGIELLRDNAEKMLVLQVDSTLPLNLEGYELMVRPDTITVIGKTPQGLFYGMQTLMQLLPAEIESSQKVCGAKWIIPCVSVVDEPAFPYRGMHMDACRHFTPVDFIKKQLDVMAMFKINRFHWHLTEDQLWTPEIKKYPRLTEVGSVRYNQDGSVATAGFYTQEEMREVVAYAAERFITIVPEVEMPGHALAALAAYPELSCTGGPFHTRPVWGIEPELFCAGKEGTFHFLEDVIDEILDIFPGEYIHIGGDECPMVRWEQCPLCQQRMKEEGLRNETELHGWFLRRMENYIRSKGRKIIGWDEILDGGASSTAAVMSWRGDVGGIKAANSSHHVIMTPGQYCYLDYRQGGRTVEPLSMGPCTTLEKIYSFNPIPESIEASQRHFVLGAQVNVWREYIFTTDHMEYMIYPRALALAELTWTPTEQKDFPDFVRRVNNAYVRLDEHHINYHIPLPEGPVGNEMEFVDTVSVAFFNTRNYPMYYTVNGNNPTIKSTLYQNPLFLDKTTTIKIITVLPSGKISQIRTVNYVKTDYAPAYQGNTQPGIWMRHVDGLFSNSAAYKNVQFSEPKVIPCFTPVDLNKLDDYKTPWVEIYEGYFEVPEDAVYAFAVNSEELWVDGKLILDYNNKVARNLTTVVTKALAKGKHRFQLNKNNSIKQGFTDTWRETTFYIQSPDDDFLVAVKESQLSH